MDPSQGDSESLAVARGIINWIDTFLTQTKANIIALEEARKSPDTTEVSEGGYMSLTPDI